MAKKAASKKKRFPKRKVNKYKKRKATKITHHSTKGVKMEKALVENFIGLQKVMVNLSSRFDNLANQISRLLELFEISAKALARKEFGIEGGKDSKKIIEKLDNLSEKAGLIGKGLVLIHESGKGLSPSHKTGEIPEQREIPQIKKPPMVPAIPRTPQKTILKGPGIQGYQKSIASTPEPKKTREPSEEEEKEDDQTNL